MTQEDLVIKIKTHTLKLRVTLGFWKKAPFKREEARAIESDPNMYFEALKLAIFYGNKEDFGWSNQEEMSKAVSDEDIESLEEDHSPKVSFAMVYYLPEAMRKATLAHIKKIESGGEELLEETLSSIEENSDKKKVGDDIA